jgi:hypothetical protein
LRAKPWRQMRRQPRSRAGTAKVWVWVARFTSDPYPKNALKLNF